MLIAERRELVFRAADVQGTGGFQGRHEDRFSGLRILAVSPMKRTPATIRVLAGWSRPKRAISRGIGHAAAGLLGQGLDLGVGVIVGHHHGVTGL
jgi:hypothetical protein